MKQPKFSTTIKISNATSSINVSTMEIIQSFFGSGGGYVSHSFHQYITSDENKILQIDHGDAYPRSIALTIYGDDASKGQYRQGGKNTTINLFKISGNVGNNYTGVCVGGIDITQDSYIVASNSIDQTLFDSSKNKERKIFISITDKNAPETKTDPIYLAQNTSDFSTPYILTLTPLVALIM